MEQEVHAITAAPRSFRPPASRSHPPGTCIERHAEALCRSCAAGFIGVGVSSFDDHVRPDLAFIRIGSKVLFPLAALRNWLADHIEEGKCREKCGPGASTAGPTPSSGRSSGAVEGRLVKHLAFPQTDLGRKLREKLRAAG